MTKSTVLNPAALVFLYSLVATAQANPQPLTASPVAYKDCAEFPSDMEFGEKPMFCNDSGSTIAFMVEATDLVAIDDESLVLNVTLNGKDIGTDRLGEPVYELGSFPKVSKNGKYAVFEVELGQGIFRELHNVKLDGTVKVYTSTSLMDVSQSVDLANPFTQTIGPFTIGNVHPNHTSSTEEGLGGAMEDTLVNGLRAAFSGGGGSNGITLHVKGDLNALVSLDILDGAEVLTSSSSTWSSDVKSMYFDTPKQSKVVLRLKYWNDLQMQTVSIKH